MAITLKNCLEYKSGTFKKTDERQIVSDGSGAAISISDCVVFPAFCDVHVHLREPGFI